MPQRPVNRPARGRPRAAQRSAPGSLMPPGYRMQQSNEFWVSWSTRRKIRFVRTMIILAVLLFLVGRCAFAGDDDGKARTTDTTTTTVEVTTTTNPMPTAVIAADATAKLPEARYIAGAGAVDGQVIVVAGLDSKRNSTDKIFRFNPETGEMIEIGTMPFKLHAAATTSLGDRVLVMGGAKGNDVYDTVFAVGLDGVPRQIGTLPSARAGATATVSPDGSTAYVVGGYDGVDATLEVLSTTDGVTFATVATLLHPVRYPAVAVEGHTLWVMGGEFGNEITKSVQRIDLDTGTVTEAAELPNPTSRAVGVSAGSSVFVVGGRTPGGLSSQIYRYEGFSGGFVGAGSLSAGRSDAAVATVGGKVWLFGGQAPETVDSIVELTPQ